MPGIPGRIINGAPFVYGLVVLRDLGAYGYVWFLVDTPATNPFPTPALRPYPLSMNAICKLLPASVGPVPAPFPDGNRRIHDNLGFVSSFFGKKSVVLALLVDITSETNTPCSVPSGTLPNLGWSALLLSEYRRGNLGWLCRGGWKHA